MEIVKVSEKIVVSVVIAMLLCYNATACRNSTSATKQVQVPCFFIFGDSLVDNGNNNGILTLARANYQPYGVDFAQGATGRFCNGRTVVDVLGNYGVVFFSLSYYLIWFLKYDIYIHALCRSSTSRVFRLYSTIFKCYARFSYAGS